MVGFFSGLATGVANSASNLMDQNRAQQIKMTEDQWQQDQQLLAQYSLKKQSADKVINGAKMLAPMFGGDYNAALIVSQRGAGDPKVLLDPDFLAQARHDIQPAQTAAQPQAPATPGQVPGSMPAGLGGAPGAPQAPGDGQSIMPGHQNAPTSGVAAPTAMPAQQPPAAPGLGLGAPTAPVAAPSEPSGGGLADAFNTIMGTPSRAKAADASAQQLMQSRPGLTMQDIQAARGFQDPMNAIHPDLSGLKMSGRTRDEAEAIKFGHDLAKEGMIENVGEWAAGQAKFAKSGNSADLVQAVPSSKAAMEKVKALNDLQRTQISAGATIRAAQIGADGRMDKLEQNASHVTPVMAKQATDAWNTYRGGMVQPDGSFLFPKMDPNHLKQVSDGADAIGDLYTIAAQNRVHMIPQQVAAKVDQAFQANGQVVPKILQTVDPQSPQLDAEMRGLPTNMKYALNFKGDRIPNPYYLAPSAAPKKKP